jgi:flagellar assembly protein FliH
MMTISHLLEDFSIATAEADVAQMISDDALEDLRLASFEQGYTAGWDDAIRAQAEDQSRITGALGRNLEDLSFTYQEALVQMMTTVEPVFHALLERVLPEALMQTIGVQIVEQCTEMAKDQLDQPVRIVVPAGAADKVRPMVSKTLAMKVEVVESRTLKAGQVHLEVGGSEREIDQERLVASLRQSVEAFFHSVNEAQKHG